MQKNAANDYCCSEPFHILRQYGPLMVCAVFIVAVGLQWNGFNSVAVADGIAYITGGVNLVSTGAYINPFGETETWFPPLYPLLIGLLSLGGKYDPVVVSRLISVGFAIITLLLMWRVFPPKDHHIAFIAGIILALNPVFQLCGNATLSQATATALSFAAFTVWLKLPENRSSGRYFLFGILVAASYLVRPEAIILLPLLGIFDLLRYSGQMLWRKYIIAGLGCVLLMSPYVIWLSMQTGKLTFSDKSEVVIAAGRSEYWKTPRERIDPVTLEMGFYHQEVTLSDEIQRYLRNWRLIGSAYSDIYRLPLGGCLVVLMFIGAAGMVRQQNWRLLWGLVCQCAYLGILAIYFVQPGYLHATLPALSLFAAYGAKCIYDKLYTAQNHVICWRTAIILLSFGVVIALAEGGSRYPRWTLTSDPPPTSILKDAGEQLQKLEPLGGVVYEAGATIGYYGRRIRRRLTSDKLDTVLRYIKAHEADQPVVWLALSSLQSEEYDPGVRKLMEVENPAFQRVLQHEDQRGKVVILRVR